MTETTEQSFADLSIDLYATLATLSADNKLWVIDDTRMLLLKINPSNRQTYIEINLNYQFNTKNPDLVYMREYQNKLYVCDKQSGIYVFDVMGNILNKIMVAGLEHFSFDGDRLCYVQGGSLYYHHLYSQQTVSYPLPVSASSAFAVVSNPDKVSLLTPYQVMFYQLKETK